MTLSAGSYPIFLVRSPLNRQKQDAGANKSRKYPIPQQERVSQSYRVLGTSGLTQWRRVDQC